MAALFATKLFCRHMSSGARRPRNCKTRFLLNKTLRVDHAGEFGAVRIYEGQLAILGRTKDGPLIREMLEQEKHHLETFDYLLPKNRVRPTVLLPFWNIAGFALGASTALMGKESAMACTVAVETAIGEHYDDQIRALIADGPNGTEKHRQLIEKIKQFRDEELEHLETGLAHDAEQAPFYKALSQTIKIGCKGAIWLSERI